MSRVDKSSIGFSRAPAAQLEEAVDHFEDAWQSGAQPSIDDHMSADAGDRTALLVELVHVDLEYRLKAGEAARIETYLQRYPKLSLDPSVVLELLTAEWRLRRREDPSVAIEEYTQRFPAYRDELQASATVSLFRAGSPPRLLDSPADGVATWSRYRILRLHARGGLGEILAAHDQDLNREVALKRLLPRQAQAPECRSRFLREAEITSQLEHPGVVPVYGLGQAADGSPVYAMRLIRGETFQEAVDRFHRAQGTERDAARRRLAFRQLLSRFLSVCNTVAYAHSRGVVHRDLKPGNILLGSFGETLVVDWGLAKASAADADGWAATAEAPTGSAASDLTQVGEVIGTPAYMSPEQANGRWDVVGPASDVYSLGATLYFVLTGCPPFGPDKIGEVLDKVRHSTFPRPRLVQKDVSPALEAVCLKAMAARPEQRYATVLALAGELEKWLADEPVAAWREPAATRVRRWVGRHTTLVTTAATALLAAAVVAVVTVLWFAAANQERLANELAETRRKDLERADLERYYFHVTAANQEWWTDRFAAANEHLAQCKPELHGWEWNYLRRRGQDSDSLLTLTGHSKEVWNVAFSPDGQSIASASLDGTVRVCNVADGRLLFTLEDHTDQVWAVAYSPDGALLATGGEDRTVRLWNAKTGRLLHTLDGPVGGVYGVAFSHDGKLLAAARVGPQVRRMDPNGKGGEVDLWDLPTAVKHEPIRIATGCTTSVAFSSDDTMLVAGTLDGMVRRWEIASRHERPPLVGHRGPVQAVAYSPDGLWIASTSNDGTTGLWDAGTGKLKRILSAHTRSAWGVAFSPDSRRVASSADDATIKIWDVALGTLLLTLHGHTGGIANIAFSPDGRRLASASDDQTVKIWNATACRTAQVFRGHKHSVRGTAVSPDGRLIASAGDDAAPNHGAADDAAVRVWDAASGDERAAFTLPGGAHAVAFSPNGDQLAAAAGDGTVRLWAVHSGWTEQILRGHEKAVLCVAFSPDGSLLASASADRTVKLWDAATGQEVRTLTGHADEVNSVAFSHDGKRLASGGADKIVRVWGTATGREEWMSPAHAAAVCAVAFSRNDERLAVATAASRKVLTVASGEISIWDLETGQTVLTMRGHFGDVLAVTYSPDGKRLVSAGSDGRLIFWEPTTGQEILTIDDAHLNCVNAVVFSADGSHLLSASCDRSVILWNGAPPEGE